MIKKEGIIFLLLGIWGSLLAQDPLSPAIRFRQKFLHPVKSDLAMEQIDSMRTVHLMIVGNIYQTEKQVQNAYNFTTGKYEFRDEFRYVQPILGLGDIVMANLKTSFSGDIKNMFSSPDEFALALKYASFNGMMHANVHTAHIDKATLKRTRSLLNDLDMFHTGAFSNIVERAGNQPLIITKKGFRIAILNYTLPMTRPEVSQDFVINEANKNYLSAELRLARSNKPDFIIVYFDWGSITEDIPNTQQQDLARYAFEHGANLVVGTAPNIPMRIDYMSYYFEGAMKEGIVAYSLGNLVGSNEEMKHRNGYILDMEIKKNNFTSETSLGDWGVVPVYTYYDTLSIPGRTKMVTVPCSAIERGDIYPNLPYIEKRRVINSAYEVRKLLGSTADELQYNMNEMVADNVMQTIDIIGAPLNNRQGRKLEAEMPVSPAPALPVVSDSGVYITPSLALLYGAPVVPKEVVEYHPKKKGKMPPKETPFTKQKAAAESVFVEPVRKTETAIEIAAHDQAVVETASKPSPSGNMKQVKGQTLEVRLDTFYRIQIYALEKLVPVDTNYYTHLKGCDIYEEDGVFKYVLGMYKDYEECYRYWKSQMLPRYKNSFIITYVDGKRILK
ncbi:MAG: CapA family protein [Bacteroidetes bacterium]|nr:CapA family protein [Bacteroidota bacterium]